MKLFKALEKNKRIIESLDRPDFKFICLFGTDVANCYGVYGDQVSFGEDYVSLQDARDGVHWLVNQLGGRVTWKD